VYQQLLALELVQEAVFFKAKSQTIYLKEPLLVALLVL
jgi:hypothetical protein